jgi:hypothetical protein
MVRAGCPEQICTKCGRARERLYKQRELRPEEFTDEIRERLRRAGATEEGLYHGEGQDYPAYVGDASDRKRRILKAMRSVLEPVGFSDCGCNAEWVAGTVLDPFAGSGTTSFVAQQLGRNSISIELNPKYAAMIKKRLGLLQFTGELEVKE